MGAKCAAPHAAVNRLDSDRPEPAAVLQFVDDDPLVEPWPAPSGVCGELELPRLTHRAVDRRGEAVSGTFVFLLPGAPMN